MTRVQIRRMTPVAWLLLLAAFVVGSSMVSVRLWGGKPERLPDKSSLTVTPAMTPRALAATNHLPEKVVRRALRLRADADWERPLADLGITPSEARTRVHQTRALAAEAGSKNWKKILLKFALWVVALVFAFLWLRRARLGPQQRKVGYSVAILVFGVALGADPSPMGTVKDAIVLWGHSRVVFPPRMIALGVFLLMVVVGNKLICSWGCQVGALQDLVFRFNRDGRDRRGRLPQWKPPFWLSNTVRVVFFVVFTAAAVIWAYDLVSPVDPFKIYKPAKLGWTGGLFVAGVLLASLFVYRPWCHFLCPFGLVGWAFEHLSITRIKVDYDACIGCEACAKACPSTVMEVILKRERRAVPDCFACGTCQDACPTGAVAWRMGRRVKPPGSWSAFRAQAREPWREKP